MPKTRISEYSTTNTDNSDIESINISEGCAPSGINNAIRELMVHLKEFQTGASGDAFTFAGGVLISGSLNTATGAMIMTGANNIALAAGAVGTPSLYANGDTNTGIFFPAADTIAFAEGGAEAMRIDSNGSVGIGTSSPTTFSGFRTLEVANSSGNAISLLTGTGVIAQTISSNSNSLVYMGSRSNHALVITTNDTERMRIDSSGNVGIGTASPNAKLVVIGNVAKIYDSSTSNANLVIRNSTTGDAAGFTIQQDGVNTLFYDNSNGYMAFATNATERARITSGGYFKASNDGTYVSSTGSYHEFRQTADNDNLYLSSTNASLSNWMVRKVATRSASSAYQFGVYNSGAGADTEFQLRGDGNGYADGTWNNNGADYAEFFESANGQALTLGATVVLDGNKVRKATAQDPASAIIGVVRPKEPSKASMVVGNTAWNKWANKYLTDDFDRYIMEDHDVVEWEEQVLEKEAVESVVDEEGNEVSPAQEAVYKTKQHSYESHNIPEGITVPADAVRKTHDDKGNKFQHYKLNPAWDKDAEYTPREQRPEWNIIGLVGQVKVLKGQPTNDRWVKMRDVSATVEEWFIR